MNVLFWVNVRFLAVVLLLTVSVNAAETPSDKIRAMLTVLDENGQFNGSILVARDGKVLYRDAFGAAASSSVKNRPEMPSDLASVSKPFTAMAVMMLAERGKIRYDDPISRYLPQLGVLDEGITIRHLLTHTSGIPDVGDLGIDHPNLKESEVVKAVVKQHAQFASPGERYRYSNTGYNLLGMMIEKVADMPLGDFLARNIFDPLEMNHTRLASKPGYTKGDGGMVSTVDDLLKWDQALYTERLVKQSTLNEAFTPAHVRKGSSTYGFGWNVAKKDGDRFVWHTGNTGPYRAFIGRRLGERILVVILTNQGNSRRPEICEAIVNILHDKPATMPKLSIAMKITGLIHTRGVEAGVQEYDRLKATQPGTFDFSDESELNTLGYELLGQGEKQAAVRIFELNAREFSSSSNVHDSLGEAYANIGQKERAIREYTKAIELDPKNLNARRMLERLK
jgi:CubicO group peptidase (beta-lactamase class C family)